jgi:hypothetical protein
MWVVGCHNIHPSYRLHIVGNPNATLACRVTNAFSGRKIRGLTAAVEQLDMPDISRLEVCGDIHCYTAHVLALSACA